MSNQRPSFAKRDREAKLKDRARAKAERRAAKRAAKIEPGSVATDDEGATNDVWVPATPPAPTDLPQ